MKKPGSEGGGEEREGTGGRREKWPKQYMRIRINEFFLKRGVFSMEGRDCISASLLCLGSLLQNEKRT
jgi:hypothetical protein